LSERNESLIDALAILSARDGQTTITVAARDALGGEVVVIHEGTCDDGPTLPAFLLEDLDASGRSVTTIDASLADLTSRAHSVALHRSAEDYDEVVACGDIPSGE
jgi:hypothetical protein